MISSTIHLRKWDAALINSMGKTELCKKGQMLLERWNKIGKGNNTICHMYRSHMWVQKLEDGRMNKVTLSHVLQRERKLQEMASNLLLFSHFTVSRKYLHLIFVTVVGYRSLGKIKDQNYSWVKACLHLRQQVS